MNGSFEDFLDALLAFESGWDRDRYETGIIQDWQLDQWAGGAVGSFFSGYTSWSQLTDAEWEAMAYRSMNSYGFVGYQFGEALLIDLGYYDDDFYYGNGAATNTWDGAWTGKNGADSLDAFMTKAVQDLAIRDAFGHNLKIIEDGLAAAGKSLDDYLGTTRTYSQNGIDISVPLTLTGILAAAHLRGAPATVSLLLNDTVSADEYGTSILQYIEQFGGYDAPSIAEAIAFFEDGLTGDEGLGTPGEADPGAGSGDGGAPAGNGTADVTAETADVAITWNWGQDTVVDAFDPATDTIFIDWFNADQIEMTEVDGGVRFWIASNNQTLLIAGVTLAALSPANFTIRDDTAAAELLGAIGASDDGGGDTGDGGTGGTDNGGTDNGDTGGTSDTNQGETGGGDATVAGHGTANVTAATADVVLTWQWGTHNVVSGFTPAIDTIFVDWFNAGEIDIAETGGNVVFTMPGNNQSVTLQGIGLADLSPANFTILHDTAAAEILGAIGADTGHGDHDHGSDAAVMHMVTLMSPSMTIDDFDPTRDMIHIEQGITDTGLEISDATGDTVIVVTGYDGSQLSTTTLTGIRLSELTLANFSIAETSALHEVADAIGATIDEPEVSGSGFPIVYDSDGSNPAAITGTTDAGGLIYRIDFYADDIVAFDAAKDRIDVGDTSVHNLIALKTPDGEFGMDNPWGPDMQILQGVPFADLTIATLGLVGNEHLRQDIGGVFSWELGAGPRDDDTVYIRSHEYGVHTVIDNFDPATMKISFLYYGTRERLSVEDSDAGLVISTLPSGQSFVFTDLSLADLQPGNVEFHHDQVIEDNLEVPFGFSQDDVTLVSRADLLTPEGPAGQITDGHQTRVGVGAPGSDAPVDPAPDPVDPDPVDPDPVDPGDGSGGGTPDGQVDVHHLTWNWAAIETISGFAASEDVLDFGNLSASHIAITESGGDLFLKVVDNGGHVYVIKDTEAEDLGLANLTAPEWSAVLTAPGGVYAQLAALGNEDLV
ncbi:hypothetical protein [Bauldia litoralis]|uniref:Uncharacterized protein n=1 Tax=Bauldia litoralis TaxID=665467 RepID=A0A1G6B5X0_9HYPH|nr:hypothetical protein [Bauldia litoralis]SDB15959.1 hypothetical protein SAMN02982931_01263 [Bauldia litoralis]